MRVVPSGGILVLATTTTLLLLLGSGEHQLHGFSSDSLSTTSIALLPFQQQQLEYDQAGETLLLVFGEGEDP